MDLRELKRLAANGENQTVEFKRKVAYPEKIVKEVVAFANADGGVLLIGVNDDGTIPGLKSPEGDVFLLNKAIEKYCKPKIAYEQGLVPISEKKAIAYYRIPSSNKKPHYVIENFENNWGRAFIRVDDKSIKASKEVREIIKRSRYQKGVKFNYGDKERLLMAYLEEHRSITLQQFADHAKLPRRVASKTLVLLTLANVLAIAPKEGEDIYHLKS